MRYSGLLAAVPVLILLLFGIPTPDNVSIPELEVLSPDNAHRITELARYGSGLLTGTAAWSPDGETLAVGGTLGIWFYDMRAVSERPQLLDLDQPVSQLAYLHDGDYLAYASTDGTRVIEVDRNREVLALPGSYVSAVHPDGQHLAAGGSPLYREEYGGDARQTVEVWDVDRSQVTQVFVTPENMNLYAFVPNGLAFSPDGRYLAASFTGYTEDTCGHRLTAVLVWDTTVPEQDAIYLPEAEDVAFSTDSRFLVSSEFLSYGWGPYMAHIHLWDIEQNVSRNVPTTPTEGEYVLSWFEFHPVTGQLVTLTDGILRLWNMPAYTLEREIDVGRGVGRFIISPDGRIVTMSKTGMALWSSDFSQRDDLVFEDSFPAVRFMEAGSFTQLDDESRLHLWRIDENQQLVEIFTTEPLPHPEPQITVSDDGRFLAYSTGSKMQLWNITDHQLLADVPIESDHVLHPMSFSTTGSRLLVRRSVPLEENQYEVFFQVWEVPNGALLREFASYIVPGGWLLELDAQLNLDGTLVGIQQMTGYQHAQYDVFSVDSGEVIYRFDNDTRRGRWTPDFKYLLVDVGEYHSSDISVLDPSQAFSEVAYEHYSFAGRILQFSPNFSQMMFATSSFNNCGGDYRQLYVHSLPDMELKWTRGLPMALASWRGVDALYNPTGSLVYSVSALLDSETGEVLVELPFGSDYSLGFSDDGKLLIVNQNGTIRLWGVPATGE